MNCVEWETRVALHAGGDLAGAEAAVVERHLGECSGCQVLWSGIRESLAEMQAAHTDLPAAADFTAVRSSVMAKLESDAQPWRRLAWICGATVAAAFLLLTFSPTRPLSNPPRVAASIPPAPQVVKVPRTVSWPVRHVVARRPRRAPVTVKLQTSDPNIIIYWIAD